MLQGAPKNEAPQVLPPAVPSHDLESSQPEAPPQEIISIKPRSEEERVIVTDPYDPEPHRQKVTLRLIGLLAGLVFVHYLFMFFLDWNGKKVESVSNAFNATLPVISGLTGAAVTYYFTRRSDK